MRCQSWPAAQHKYKEHLRNDLKSFVVISGATARETVNPFLQMSCCTQDAPSAGLSPGPLWRDGGHQAAAQRGQRSQQDTHALTLTPSHQSFTVKKLLFYKNPQGICLQVSCIPHTFLQGSFGYDFQGKPTPKNLGHR